MLLKMLWYSEKMVWPHFPMISVLPFILKAGMLFLRLTLLTSVLGSCILCRKHELSKLTPITSLRTSLERRHRHVFYLKYSKLLSPQAALSFQLSLTLEFLSSLRGENLLVRCRFWHVYTDSELHMHLRVLHSGFSPITALRDILKTKFQIFQAMQKCCHSN
jgi:hypothetical protein